MQNLKFRSWRGAEIDAVKVSTHFWEAQKEEKRIKIDPFTPENSAFPEFPVEFSTEFSFSPSVVGASLFDIHALVYSLPPYSPLTIPPLLYIKFRLFYIYMTSNLFLCPWLWDRKGSSFFQIWKFSFLRSEKVIFPFRRKMTFSKIDLFTSEKWKCTGVKNANFAFFDVFRFLWQNQKKMFDDWDEIWRVGRGDGDTFTVLRGLSDFNEEARNMGLNTFSFS